MTHLTVVLVGCSAFKLAVPAPARELYRSDVFQKSLAYAELRSSSVYIASAFHGLVRLHRTIAPYDLTITDLSPRNRTAWGWQVAYDLTREHPALAFHAVLLMGESYAQHIRASLMGSGFSVEEPLKGMQIGERKAWLAGEIGRLQAEATARAVVSR